MRPAWDILREVADALRVQLELLVALAVVGFAVLAAALATESPPLGIVACVAGFALTVIGVRAAVAPSRPLDFDDPRVSSWITSTRRAGMFYVAAGLIWMLLSITIALGAVGG